MKLLRKCVSLIGMALFAISFASCSFQLNKIEGSMNINDVSRSTSYIDIVSKGYMGGSLIYNEADESLGQLSNGVAVAIRLSNAQRYDISDSEAVFQEQPGSAVYGLLIIQDINLDRISLKSELYDIEGNVIFQKMVSLSKNECADLNDDGIADIQYAEPKSKRSGYEKSMYLNFLSSQEDLNITMYAVLPEQYPGKTYPNGIIGVNNDDKFIVQKYVNTETSQRSVITGVYKGDYVIDNMNNKYQLVTNNQYARHARSVNDGDLVDLQEEINIDNTVFLFTEEDFAFSSPDEFLSVLPEELTSKYSYVSGIEKLNKILEDKEVLKIVDETQGSILPEEEKQAIFNQFDFLTTEEIIQLNRVFLEKNYLVSCPQRVTVSSVITEVLPLASVVFTDADVFENTVEQASSCDTGISENTNRAAYASFEDCKSEDDYKNKLNALENDFNSYKKLFSKTDFNVPVRKDDKVKVSLTLKNSAIGVGIKGSFSSTWGSVNSSLGAAVFFKASADIGIGIDKTSVYEPYSEKYEGTPTEAQTKDKKVTLPIVKKEITLYEFQLCQSTNLANVAIGPILIGINLDLGIGLPIKTSFEMDCEISYAAHIAGLAKAGVSVGVDYGIGWKKVWFVKVPVPYTNWHGDASASAQAICYFDKNFETLDFDVSKLALQFSVEPYVKAGLSMSVAAVVNAGCGIQFGTKGYANFGYYDPYLRASYGLNDTSSIYANVFLGLKGIKVLGINIGDIGKKWEWQLLNYDKTIIPETTLFEYKIN